MYTLVKCETRPITRGMMGYLENLELAPGQRPLRAHRVSHLVREIERGAARPFDIAIAVHSGKHYLVNGQHSVEAFKSYNGNLPKLTAVVSEYSCPTLSAVARLYATFDGQISKRSTTDSIRGTCENMGIPTNVGAAVVGGLIFYDVLHGGKLDTRNSACRVITPEMRQAALEGCPEFCHAIVEITNGHLNTHAESGKASLRRAHTIAAMWATFPFRPQWETFWRAVHVGDGEIDSAERRVHSYLLTQAKAVGNPFDQKIHYVKLIKMWNMWVDGQEVKSLPPFNPSAKIPLPKRPRLI